MQQRLTTSLLITLLFIIFHTWIAYSSNNAGNTGLSFLKLGAGSRAVGMGEAYTAIANDVLATYWNPAGLSHLNAAELTFTHNKWFQDVTNEFFAFGFRAGTNAFGISLMYNTIGGIEQRVKASAEPLDVLTAHDVMLGFSYARPLGANLNVGLTVKYLYQKIYIESSSGMAADVGCQFQTPMNGLKTGLALQNFGYQSKLKEESIELPQTIRAGVAYQLPLQFLTGELILATDYMKIFESRSHVNIGLEYSYINYFALRFGYQTGFDDKGIQGGFGIGFHRYRLDYAYVPFSSDLGNSHRLSFGIRF